MTKHILMGASVLALIAALPAFAETKAKAELDTGDKIEKTLEDTGESIERGTEKAGAAVKGAYNDVKAYFTDDSDDIIAVNIETRLTSDELIGKTVRNSKGETLGKIEDILITADGDAEMIVINDGMLGLGGKQAAFDFDVLKGYTPSGDAVVVLTDAHIEAAKRFELRADAKDIDPAKTFVMPADHYSVAKIMDSKVYDARGKAVADIDTVAFDGDDADYVVITFNKILGMGGDKAALNIEAIEIKPRDDKYAFVLTQKQSARFETVKSDAKAN